MAVQKSRKSPSKIGMRRSHDFLTKSELSVDPVSGEIHRRHHIAPDGRYRGQEIVTKPIVAEDEEE